MPVPLFNEILEKNQLIKGRLNANLSELEKLYRALNKDSDRLKRKQIRQEDIIKSAIAKRNEIKFQIKRNSESVQKSFFPSSEKISLLYKKMGDSFYIKARFYWEGKQREVQVGSIPIVLEIINSLIVNKMLTGIKPIRAKKLTWKDIKKRPILLEGIKEIASLKSQEYILRKLIYDKLNILGSIDNSDKKENESLEIFEKQPDIPTNNRLKKVNDSDIEENDNWYDKWRKENL